MILPNLIPERTLLEWLGAWSVLGWAGMLADKLLAKLGAYRISERSFFIAALFGGFPGIIVGGLMVRHKTSKGEFWVPIGFAAALWAAFLVVYYLPRLVNF